jgi:transcriptional regulator with XRE-family HTH domain
MREPQAIEQARRALGVELAAHRQAAGYSQTRLASLVGYSRSTIANVEIGRQRVPQSFWERADNALRAGGDLVTANDEVEAAARHEHELVARDARSVREGYTGALSVWPDDGAALDLIAAAASEAREHAEHAAVTEIGPGMLDQLKADVVRLGRAYMSAPPYPLFVTMQRALGRVHVALNRLAYPAQARQLNFLAGALCGLMANASLDLGREEAAHDLANAAWTHGKIVDHGPLMGWARGTQALAAIWDHRYTDATDHAADGLHHLPAGAGAARLHAILGRALASNGDHAQAMVAIRNAAKAMEDTLPDELHGGIAGEFAFGQAKLQYYRALISVSAEDPAQAESAAQAAIRLYQAAPGWARSYGCEALAYVQLATAQLMSNKLDDAADAIGSLLRLNPDRRISSLGQHLETSRELLHSSSYRDSAAAQRLEQQLAAFSAASVTRAIPGAR